MIVRLSWLLADVAIPVFAEVSRSQDGNSTVGSNALRVKLDQGIVVSTTQDVDYPVPILSSAYHMRDQRLEI